MKNLFILFSLVAITFFASCKKDNSIIPTTLSESIIGTWNLTSVKNGATEQMPNLITSGQLIFDTNNNFMSVTNTFFGVEVTNQTYTVDDVNNILTTTKPSGKVTILKVLLDGKNITFTYTDDQNQFFTIKASK